MKLTGRPKTVYQNNSSLAYDWAYGHLSRGADWFRANNLMATHNRIYSYGRHFCIAEKRSDGLFLITERTYSPSTGRHKRIVTTAVQARNIVFVPSLNNGSAPQDWLETKLAEGAKMFESAKRARGLKIYKASASISLLNEAAKYSEIFGLQLPSPAALPHGYLDFMAVEAFKAKCNNETWWPSLHRCYLNTPNTVAV